jgi:hypothetical protein
MVDYTKLLGEIRQTSEQKRLLKLQQKSEARLEAELNGSLTGKERISICKECDLFNQTLRICTECHCFMPAKVLIKSSSCPKNKW